MIVAAAKCTIKISTLRSEPFLLPWGSSIYARIIARNDIGDSIPSEIGNNAIILTVPGAPINLQTIQAQTSGT
jgi:hypothetical protein